MDHIDFWLKYIAEKLIIIYFAISIILEILNLIFFFTPNKEDDRIISKIINFWILAKKYFFILSIRTPLTIIFSLLNSVIAVIVKYVKNKYKKVDK